MIKKKTSDDREQAQDQKYLLTHLLKSSKIKVWEWAVFAQNHENFLIQHKGLSVWLEYYINFTPKISISWIALWRSESLLIIWPEESFMFRCRWLLMMFCLPQGKHFILYFNISSFRSIVPWVFIYWKIEHMIISSILIRNNIESLIK